MYRLDYKVTTPQPNFASSISPYGIYKSPNHASGGPSKGQLR